MNKELTSMYLDFSDLMEAAWDDNAEHQDLLSPGPAPLEAAIKLLEVVRKTLGCLTTTTFIKKFVSEGRGASPHFRWTCQRGNAIEAFAETFNPDELGVVGYDVLRFCLAREFQRIRDAALLAAEMWCTECNDEECFWMLHDYKGKNSQLLGASASEERRLKVVARERYKYIDLNETSGKEVILDLNETSEKEFRFGPAINHDLFILNPNINDCVECGERTGGENPLITFGDEAGNKAYSGCVRCLDNHYKDDKVARCLIESFFRLARLKTGFKV